MRTLLVLLTAAILLGGCIESQKNDTEELKKQAVVERDVAGKKIKMITVSASALKNNLLGDKAEREIGIYLPENYKNETKRYPVVYFLVGYNNTIEDFDNWAHLEKIMETIRANQKIKEMIFVAIDGQTKAGGSFYTNSPVMGNWEKFIAIDVVNFIDDNYRTIRKPESRGLTGHSMGGFGVINVGMKYPEVFGYLYSMNPGLFDQKGLTDAIFNNKKSIEDNYNIIQNFNNADEKQAAEKFDALVKKITFSASYGMAFSYTEKPPYYEIPYEKVTDNFIVNSEKIKKWENGFGNWKEKIGKYRENLKKIKGFVIDYGVNDDYPWIPRGCRYFEEIMKNEGMDIEMRPNSGDHGNKVQERMTQYMAPYFSEKLKRE